MCESPPLTAIIIELVKAKQKHGYFPDDPIHAAAVLGEESGELTQAALDYVYSGGDIQSMKEEAAQCGAMAIRFLENVERYEKWMLTRSAKHEQDREAINVSEGTHCEKGSLPE